MTAATALGTAAVLGLGQLPALAAPSHGVRPADSTAFDATAAQSVRQEQCLLSTVARLGGPGMRQVAAQGLDGTSDQLATNANPSYWTATPLHAAFSSDSSAALAAMDQLAGRAEVWRKPLEGLPVPNGFTGFDQLPQPDFFQQIGLGPWLNRQFWSQEGTFYQDPTPLAGPDSAGAATALGNQLYPVPGGNDPDFQRKFAESQAWQSMTSGHGLFADDTRLLLQDGGFPRTAPAAGTAEFRIAVEDLKARFASCEWRNPVDPDSVLGAEVQTASTEWQAELAEQSVQRDAVLAANAKATAALATGTQALGEALGQSWQADRLTRWQAYWGPGGAGWAGSGPIVFHLRAAGSLCLDDKGGSAVNGTAVQAWTCNASVSQQWRPDSIGSVHESNNGALDGALYDGANGKCLDVDGTHGTPKPGTRTQIWGCNRSANQHWQYTTTGGVTRLYNVGTKLCLDLPSGTSGQAAVMSACNGTTAQEFTAQQNNKGTSTGSDSLSYPKQAQFTAVQQAIQAAQASAKAQLQTAQQQAAIAQQAASDSDAAVQQAYTIADAAGQPRGRGLLAGQQAAQVTKASAAALQATAQAAQTAYQATTASAADSETLSAQADTQAAASKAAFRLAAAKAADDQAKAAAQGAAIQAANAAKSAQDAQAQLAVAQQAEQTAKDAAATAHAKRLAAEADQAQAAADKNQAAADQAQAAADRQTASADATTAANSLADAQAAQSTAAAKAGAAHQADEAATTARQQAWDAAQQQNALQAKAEAADAYADAESSNSDAADARSAANQADQDAANATIAAGGASSAAAAATQAAADADAAATQAQAAASRAQSNADAAAAAKATADAAVKTDEAAAAKAINDAQNASQDATNAKQDAATAEAQAKAAQQNAIAAAASAQQAQGNAATTAGFAYATAQAATAAGQAAQQVSAPANDAVQLGAPYVDSDASAGLAVLSAQAAKTIADQQQAVAAAKAQQAQQAAQTAQAVADAASGDAKGAQVLAADAAAQAAQAQVSVQQALASAALAEKYAAQAQATVAVTIQYDQQAAADSAAAQSAAQAAAGDAADARASATAAEADASAAQASAAQAQASAATAREVAAQADKDAAAAEAAAKDASQQAASAQQAATAAEQQKDANDLNSGGATGLAHVFTAQKITPIGDPHQDTPCVLDGMFNSSCTVTFTLHFDLEVDFYLCDSDSAPADATAATCPPDSVVFLGPQYYKNQSTQVRQTFTEWDVTKTIDSAIIHGLWDGLTKDFVDCAHGSLSGCAWAATWFVPAGTIAKALDGLRVLDAALHTGVGLADAYKALQALNLDARSMAAIDAEVHLVEDAFQACKTNSFPGGTQVLLADGTHKPISQVHDGDLLLATDPDTGAFRAEPVTDAFSHTTDRLVDITLADGGTLTSTAGHRVFVEGHGWTYVSDLRTGDRLRAADGSPHRVTALRDRSGLTPQQVYDLTVDGLHTFYVRTTAGQDVLVHNCLDLVGDEGVGGAHTITDHVSINDRDLQAKAEKDGEATRWNDQATAMTAVNKAFQGWLSKPSNAKRLQSWLIAQSKRGGAFNPRDDLLEFSYEVRDGGASLGTKFVRGGNQVGTPTGNTVWILLKYVGKGHPQKYVVYTSYPA